MAVTYIGYYTTGTPYADEAKTLIESLRAFGLRHQVCAVPNLGTWQKNTQYKSRFVQGMRLKISGPMVYLDVDALVIKKPVLFDYLSCDIAACRHDGFELLSGTVYFGDTQFCRKIIDAWVALCDKYPNNFPAGLLPTYPTGSQAWDQRLLDIAMIQNKGVDFRILPPEYTYIIGISQQLHPDLDPVILHTRGRMRHEQAVNNPR